MKPEIDADAILDKLAAGKKDDREKTSLYLSRGLYERFKQVCSDVSPSQVIEELMRLFLESKRKK
jgi:hypothetical protein